MSLISAALTGVGQFFGRARPVSFPAPVAVKRPTFAPQFLPDLSLNDGSGWLVGTSNTQRIGPTGTVIYTVTYTTDIDVNFTVLYGVWVDYVNSRLYFWGITFTPSCRLAYTTIAAKAMTVRAAAAIPTTTGTSPFMTRLPSGDFVVYAASATTLQKYTIPEATGVPSVVTSVTFGGASVALNPNTLTSNFPNVYWISPDETIAFTMTGAVVTIARGGGVGYYPLALTNYPLAAPGVLGAINHSNGVMSFILASGTGNAIQLPREFPISDFVVTLNKMADALGLPT